MHIIHDLLRDFLSNSFFFFADQKLQQSSGKKNTQGLCQETQGSGGFGFHQEFKAKIFQELKLQICDLSLNASENPSDYFSSVLLRIAMIVCVVFFLSTCCSEILREYDLILLHEFCVFQE